MISRKTLFGRAQVYVASIGPRVSPDGQYFGLYLTMQELRIFAGSMKFNPTNKTVPRYVDDWEFCGWCRTQGDIYELETMEDSVVWFPIPPESVTLTMVAAERAGFPESRVVTTLDRVMA